MDSDRLPLSWHPFAAYLQEAWPQLTMELTLVSPDKSAELMSHKPNHQESNPFLWDMPLALKASSPVYEALPLFLALDGLDSCPMQDGLCYAYTLPPGAGLNKNPAWLVRLHGASLSQEQKKTFCLWLHKEKIRQRKSCNEPLTLSEISSLVLASGPFFAEDKEIIQEIFPLCGLPSMGWLLPYMRQFASWSQGQKHFFYRYSFSWKDLPTLFALPESLRNALVDLLTDFPPSQSLSRELFALAEDNILRKTRFSSELISDIQSTREHLDIPQQAAIEPAQHQARKKHKRKAKNTLLNLRNQWRQAAYPEEASYEQKLHDFLRYQPPPSSTKMTLPRYYETQQSHITLTFEKPEQVLEIADYLKKIARDRSFLQLFKPPPDA